MKHIFVVHSNITYLSALGVISELGLDKGDFIICSQYYMRTKPVPVIKLKLFSRNILRANYFFNFARHIDRLVGRFTGGAQFALYIPAMTKPAKIFATHPACVSINFMEEGIGSYCAQFPAENHVYEYRTFPARASFSSRYFRSLFIAVANVLRGETPYITAIPLNYTSYAGSPNIAFYGFHNSVFPLAATRTVISMSDIAAQFSFPKKFDLTSSCVLIGEGLFSLVSSHNVGEYIDVINDHLIPWLKSRNISVVYIKHHYNESDESKSRSADALLAAGIELYLIPDNIILETELIGCSGVTLIGCSSSLLFYGALMGCNSYSYAGRLNHPLIDIESYWQQVELI